MNIIRCPFCEWHRNHRDGDVGWSAVQSLRELAVHLAYKHPAEWGELVETVGPSHE